MPLRPQGPLRTRVRAAFNTCSTHARRHSACPSGYSGGCAADEVGGARLHQRICVRRCGLHGAAPFVAIDDRDHGIAARAVRRYRGVLHGGRGGHHGAAAGYHRDACCGTKRRDSHSQRRIDNRHEPCSCLATPDRGALRIRVRHMRRSDKGRESFSMRPSPFVPVFRCLLAPVIAAACIAGCGSSSSVGDAGGNIADADAATAGDTAAGTDGSNPGDASSPGDSSTAPDARAGCPPSEPGVGSACSAVSGICSYGGGLCCRGAFTCSTDGTWQIVEATCACTVPAPDAGGPCGGHTCDTGTSCCGPPECGFCISNQSGIACATSCDGGGFGSH
jgi:hypothetical protein